MLVGGREGGSDCHISYRGVSLSLLVSQSSRDTKGGTTLHWRLHTVEFSVLASAPASAGAGTECMSVSSVSICIPVSVQQLSQ